MSDNVVTPLFRSWVQFIGLWQDELFVAFNNGDCAQFMNTNEYHYNFLKCCESPGAWINEWMANMPYKKIHNPTPQILNQTTDCTDVGQVPRYWSISPSGISNPPSNGTFILEHNMAGHEGECTWTAEVDANDVWQLQISSGPDWVILYAISGLTIATYNLVATPYAGGNVVIDYTSDTGVYTGWPATITLTPYYP